MSTTNSSNPRDGMWIEIEADGPYTIHGEIPLVRKTQVVSEYGEPLTWRKDGDIETSGDYQLCRCGQSEEKPFCDCAHRYADWDPTETAETSTTAERQGVIPGGTNLIVRRDDISAWSRASAPTGSPRSTRWCPAPTTRTSVPW